MAMKNKPEYLIVHTQASTIISDKPQLKIVNDYHRVARDENGDFKYHDGKPSSLGYWVGYHKFIERTAQ
mgnify:FL=1